MVGRRSTRGRQRASVARKEPVKAPEEKKPEIEEETYFLNPDSVSPHLYCSICQEVFKEPYRAPCGHSYCKRCIFDWLSHNAICPADRRPITTSQLHHDFLVENIIDDYVVACPWRALGCQNVGPLHQLKQHKLVCPLNPNTMPKVLQDYSVKMLTTAQAALEKKITQRVIGQQQQQQQQQRASTGSSSLFDQLLSEEILRDNQHQEQQKLQQQQQQQQQVREDAAGSASSGNSNNNNNHNLDDDDDDDDEANLPGGQLPSLRMRLHMNSRRNDGNSDIVEFLEHLETPAHLALPQSISRFCESSANDAAPAAKRSRH